MPARAPAAAAAVLLLAARCPHPACRPCCVPCAGTTWTTARARRAWAAARCAWRRCSCTSPVRFICFLPCWSACLVLACLPAAHQLHPRTTPAAAAAPPRCLTPPLPLPRSPPSADTQEGGETAFPSGRWLDAERQTAGLTFSECAQSGVAAQPRKGNAVLFWDTKPGSVKQDKWSLHTGCPVTKGTKWAAVKWIHARSFGGLYPPKPLATSGASLMVAEAMLQARLVSPVPLEAPEGRLHALHARPSCGAL